MSEKKNYWKKDFKLPDQGDLGKENKRGTLVVKPESDNEINHELTLEVSADLKSIKGWCRDIDNPYLLIERFRTPPQVDFAKMLAEEADGDVDKVI